MAAVNKLELVIQVEAGQANAAVKSVGISFRDLERQAARSATVSSGSFNGLYQSVARSAKEIRNLVLGGVVLTFSRQIGEALAQVIVAFTQWDDSMQRVRRTLHEVFNPVESAAVLLREENRREAVEKTAKAILESEERIRESRRRTDAVGLTGEATIQQQFRNAVQDLRERASREGLLPRQEAKEFEQITREFSKRIIEERRRVSEETRKISEEAIRRGKELALRGAEDAIQAMQKEKAFRADLLRDRVRDEAQALDLLVKLEREAALARLDPYQKAIQEMVFQDEDRVKQFRELRDRQLISEQDFRAGLHHLETLSAARTQDVLNDQAREIRDQQMRLFESLKYQAGGVFDALLDKGESVFSALGNAFKTAILTAIKDVVTSHVARMLLQLFGGIRVGVAGGGTGGGGALGTVGALGGLAPIIGGGGFGIPGIGPGGTAPTFPTGGGGLGSAAGLAGSLPGLKSFLGIGGSIPIGPGMATTFQAATLLQKLSAIGHSPAALLGGGLLALSGLQRGGLSGLGMTAAGGALIGFKFGGPLGAAIGGVAGAIAGLFRLGAESPEEKAKKKIRQAYGVEIRDKGVLRQIVEMARQGFGGNLDMAIRSQPVIDLIELYALSTGQRVAGLPARMRPVSLAQSGGALFQQPGFSQGSPLPSFGGLSSVGLDRIGAGTAQNAGPVVIQLDGPATTALLRGEAVQAIAQNPRVVQSAALSATKASAGRRELLSLQLSPGTLTS